MSLGRHSGDAGKNLSLQRSSRQAKALDATVSGLADLDADQLRLQWRNHLGGTAPAHLPRWLLLRVLAYRLQAAALGDLDKATVRSIRASRDDAIDLSSSPFKTRKPRTRDGTGLNSGALLVREWQGKLQSALVLDKGFAWNGQTFGSLSQVAKAITGTSWNGHRFFGLRSVKDQASKRSGARPNADEDRRRGAARSKGLDRTETNDEVSKGIGHDETERAVVNAKCPRGQLTMSRTNTHEPKPSCPVEADPAGTSRRPLREAGAS
jgi:hypothetical protein